MELELGIQFQVQFFKKNSDPENHTQFQSTSYQPKLELLTNCQLTPVLVIKEMYSGFGSGSTHKQNWALTLRYSSFFKLNSGFKFGSENQTWFGCGSENQTWFGCGSYSTILEPVVLPAKVGMQPHTGVY